MFYAFNDDSKSEKNIAVMENSKFISCIFMLLVSKV